MTIDKIRNKTMNNKKYVFKESEQMKSMEKDRHKDKKRQISREIESKLI